MGVRQTYLYINANINNTKRCPVLLGLAESNEGSCVIIRVSWEVKCYPYSKSYECLHYLSFSNAKTTFVEISLVIILLSSNFLSARTEEGIRN